VPPLLNPNAVFLNIPYDEEFRSLYVACIVGLYRLGLEPFLASGIPGGERRLDRILAPIGSCRHSIHDLSRAELSATPPATPRFNMPLELGLTIAWAKLHPKCHTWFLWESTPRRLQEPLSDLEGTDPHLHFGTAKGVLSELRNAFVRADAPPIRKTVAAYCVVEDGIDEVLSGAGSRNLYSASVFGDLCLVAEEAAHRTYETSISTAMDVQEREVAKCCRSSAVRFFRSSAPVCLRCREPLQLEAGEK
jgi:hypothetical protein